MDQYTKKLISSPDKLYFGAISVLKMWFFDFFVRQCDWLLGDRQGGIADVNEGLDQSRYVNSMFILFLFYFFETL